MMSFNFNKNSTDPAMELCYKGYIRQRRKLKNGWKAVILVNHVAIVFDDKQTRIVTGSFKDIFEANDGKFMLIKRDKTKAVFNAKGDRLADFSNDANLFVNGWYSKRVGDDVSLFDKEGSLICSKVTKVSVFNDGRYFISVLSGGDANKVGFHNSDGSRILFTNDKGFKRIYPFFFIADGSLYDINGECLIEANQGSTFNRNLVRCIGALPFFKS